MQNYTPGSIVTVDIGFGFEHWGIISNRTIHGQPMVISASLRKGEVAEESIQRFSGGNQVKIKKLHGYLSAAQILNRARVMIGKKYNLFNWNCEHFARWAHGLKVESKQLQAGICLTAVLACIMIQARRK